MSSATVAEADPVGDELLRPEAGRDQVPRARSSNSAMLKNTAKIELDLLRERRERIPFVAADAEADADHGAVSTHEPAGEIDQAASCPTHSKTISGLPREPGPEFSRASQARTGQSRSRPMRRGALFLMPAEVGDDDLAGARMRRAQKATSRPIGPGAEDQHAIARLQAGAHRPRAAPPTAARPARLPRCGRSSGRRGTRRARHGGEFGIAAADQPHLGAPSRLAAPAVIAVAAARASAPPPPGRRLEIRRRAASDGLRRRIRGRARHMA